MYFLQFALLYTLFYLSYRLVLSRTGQLNANRYYLLGIYGLALLLPLLPWPPLSISPDPVTSLTPFVPSDVATPPINTNTQLTKLAVQPEQVVAVATSQIDWSTTLILCYLSGVFFFLLRYGFQLWSLRSLISRSSPLTDHRWNGRARLINSGPNKNAAFSYGRCFYVSPNLLDSPDADLIMAHEHAHTHQRHTIDLTVSELFTTLLWWHPIAWLHRRDLRMNLEFLADRAVLNAGYSPKKYQLSLLRYCEPFAAQSALTFAQPPLKTRIVMMKSNQRSTRSYSLTILTALLLAISLTACLEEPTSDLVENATLPTGITEIYISATPTMDELKQIGAAVEATRTKMYIDLTNRKNPGISLERGDDRAQISLDKLVTGNSLIALIIDNEENKLSARYQAQSTPPLGDTNVTIFRNGNAIPLPSGESFTLEADPKNHDPNGYRIFTGPSAWEESQDYLAQNYLEASYKYYYNDSPATKEEVAGNTGIQYVKINRLIGLPLKVHVSTSDEEEPMFDLTGQPDQLQSNSSDKSPFVKHYMGESGWEQARALLQNNYTDHQINYFVNGSPAQNEIIPKPQDIKIIELAANTEATGIVSVSFTTLQSNWISAMGWHATEELERINLKFYNDWTTKLLEESVEKLTDVSSIAFHGSPSVVESAMDYMNTKYSNSGAAFYLDGEQMDIDVLSTPEEEIKAIVVAHTYSSGKRAIFHIITSAS